MRDVALRTREGEFVETVQLPPFVAMPEVIVWGERFFARRDDDGLLGYFEVFAYWVPPMEVQQ